MTPFLPRVALGGALLILGPGAAWACLPHFHDHEMPVRVVGENGTVTWQHDIWELTTLTGPEDLGGGFVVQFTHEGDHCYGERSVIVQDCASGEALSVGGAYEAMIPEISAEEDALLATIRARAAEGRSMPVAEIAQEAAATGVESVVPLRVDSRISLRGFEFQLGEACRRFYPRLTP
jgi:hypothetical protein